MKKSIHIPQLLIAAGLSLAPAMLQAQALGDGLLNYWNLDGTGSDSAGIYLGATSTIADDVTPAGTVDAATIAGVDGLFGGAGVFERTTGTDGRLAAPQGADLNRASLDVTISLWVQFDNDDAGWQALAAKGEGANYRIAIENNGGDPANNSAGYAGGRGDLYVQPGINVQDGVWHHIVATTVNGGDASLYVNGELVASGGGATIVDEQNAHAGEFWIGNNPGNNAGAANNRMWDGKIDDVAMWDRALSLSEVMQIHTAGVGGDPLATLLILNEDSDLDGLPDEWEDANGLDKNDDGTTDINNGPDGDPDMDNLSNLEEFNAGTHPNDEDSDDDNVNDDIELINGTDPNDEDSDDDNLTDDIETNNGPNSWVSPTDTGTDPNNPDTDGDGLRDDYENNDNNYVSPTQTGTDPTLADSDDDEIPDGYESDNELDPNADDAGLDPDLDTLTNLQEYLGNDTIAETGDETNPQLKDTDSDFSDDNVEITNGTDPVDPDSDGDTLLDGHETNNGPDSYVSPTDTGTDPLVGDTDGDGTHDGAEVIGSRDPTVPDNTTSGLTEKLLAYWTFDNTLDDIAHGLSADSMVADNGTFTGPETDVFFATEGALFGESALEQNGAAGWVTVPSSVDTLRGVDNAVSVSAWVKVTGFNVNWQTIICHGELAQWRMARRNGESTPSWAGGNTDLPGENVGPAIDDLGWHHVVGVSDPVAGLTAIYVDGQQIATGGSPTLSDISEGEVPDLFIGANSQRANREWNGQIDDVAIWGRGLSQEEVTQIFEAGVSLGDLLGGGAELAITDFSFDPSVGANGEFSLTFNSRQGATYSLYSSSDLEVFLEEDDGIPGEDGSTTITFPKPGGQDKQFYRIEQN